MTIKHEGGTMAIAREYEFQDFDEAIILSTTYANVVPIDSQYIRESVMQFTNKGTVSLTYKIFGSAKKGQKYKTINPEIDDAWINLLSTGTYDHNKETTIPLSVLATGTITCVSVTGEVHADGTVTCASAVAGDTATFNGLLYTGVDGSKGGDNTKFSVDTGDNETATDLADSIQNDTRIGTLNDLTATATTNVVTAVQTVGGAGGNATTLVSSNGTRLAVSGATFSNGITGDTATVNGIKYTATVGVKADDTEFSVDTSDDATATDLADSIDDDVRTGITKPLLDVTATATTNVVTILADETGDVGNDIDLSSDDGTSLAVSGALLASGFSARAFETLTNPWRYVIIMVKAASGTPTVKVWHRGEN